MAHGPPSTAASPAPPGLIALTVRRAIQAAAPFIPAAICLVILWPVAAPVAGGGDQFQFWYAGRLVDSGRSPYDLAAWQEAASRFAGVDGILGDPGRSCLGPEVAVCAWLYLPLTAWLFAPFGLFDAPVGTVLVEAFTIVTAIAGAIIATVVFGPRATMTRSLLLALIVVSHPFVIDVRAGHFVGLLLIGLAAVAVGLRDRRPGWVAAGALILALKAHLFVLLGVVVLGWLLRTRAWRTIALASAVLAATLGAALARSPEALGAIAAGSAAKSGLAWSTAWAFASQLLPGSTPLAFGALLLISVGAAIAVVALDLARAETVVAAGAALSLIVAPYVQPYDLLLLVPALGVAARLPLGARARPAVLLAIAAVYAAGTWPMLVWAASGVLPILVLVVLALSGLLSWRARSLSADLRGGADVKAVGASA